MIQVEHRALAGELRADTAARKLQGYASVFNSDARIGSFVERVAPGAFRSSLASGDDILCLVDHDPSALLGRTKSGTLTLAEDQRGLAFTVQLPDTQLARDTLALVERGDCGGCSIGFRLERDSWPAPDRRVLQSVELVEVSVVRAFPAYPQTSVQARSWPSSRSIRATRTMTPAARRRWIETL
jgi:Escherichia/Staphylococcus phage prohead protease